MPSFTSRHYTPERFRPLSFSPSEDEIMDDITQTTPSMKPTSTASGSLAMVPSDGSLLDYFDLPSPPSTPQRPTHNLSYSSLNSSPRTSSSPGYVARHHSAASLSTPGTTPQSSPATSTVPRWPTASQRIQRLPTRSRSRSTSSASSSSTFSSSFSHPRLLSTSLSPEDLKDVEMSGMNAMGPGGPFAPAPSAVVRPARRTPYYPPNSSRNVDRTRVYMNRGPHFVPNWTPLSSLPRHVQLRIEESMTRFTAI